MAADGQVTGISCANAQLCVATAAAPGWQYEQDVAWDGTQWSMTSVAASRAVSCTSPSFCMSLNASRASQLTN
ncbi:MAG TPA: hypothetical protein VFU36_11675 [Jatrophihabitans sp.]|nr:hypothetical protein [Jatrophihabitans sp.]